MEEQAESDVRDRRIMAMRQVVSLLRGKRSATAEQQERWADEIDKIADEEASDARQTGRRAAHRHIVAYLKSELGIDRNFVGDIVSKLVEEQVAHESQRISDAISRTMNPSIIIDRVVAGVRATITPQVQAAVLKRVQEMLQEVSIKIQDSDERVISRRDC